MAEFMKNAVPTSGNLTNLDKVVYAPMVEVNILRDRFNIELIF
ncbi:hypothetical protein FOQG_15941 [Fusarium oxysporum f. sp. raphani 54005]|uniref:Uncharacterized protein n=1 Tax=Fusarium oxysporum f. sp. raphani 54005 TaxID=1089458 RepID=X0C9V1_FUSOX|nr:hypothetical protein FOQG_15941 [Fusarium oxysporum f. sp. raphani 54005]